MKKPVKPKILSAGADRYLRCPQCPHHRTVTCVLGGVVRALCSFCGWIGVPSECPA